MLFLRGGGAVGEHNEMHKKSAHRNNGRVS